MDNNSSQPSPPPEKNTPAPASSTERVVSTWPPEAAEEEKQGKSFWQSKFSLIFLAVLVVGLIFGLTKIFKGKKSSPLSKEVTLVYWGLWEPGPVVDGVISQFEREYPGIKVKYEMQSARDYRARLENALKAGRGPDIFRFHQTWLGVLANDLAPVPEAVKGKLALDSDYFPSVKKAIQFKGKYYALPLMVDDLALYYNKDLLAKAGVSLPRTWWGLQRAASQLTEKTAEGRIKIAGVALGTTNNVDHFSDILGLMLLQSGVDPAKPQGKAVEEVLEYYTLFASKYHVWDETLRRSTDAFASGQLAFYFAPSWRYFEIKQRNPNLNFGITVVPQLPKVEGVDFEKAEKGEAELTNINWASFWIDGVASQSKHQQESWEFLSYLASKKGLTTLYTAASNTRDFGEIYPIVSLAEGLKSNPYLVPFIDQAKTANWWYLCSDTHDATLNDGMIKYYQDAINSILAGNTPSSVTETLFSGVGEILQRFQL